MARKRFEWKVRDQIISLGERTLIVGVLNVTPDSFSDGGEFLDPDRAFAHAMELEDAGADILEIGAESTRPGSVRISEAEELRRLVPVLKRLRGKISIPLAVDTYKSGVATKALELGASIINDPSALTFDPELARAASNGDAGLILNHMRGTPDSWAKLPPLKNPVAVIVEELSAAVHRAVLTGMDRKRIVVDPGLGFGKRKEQNAEILAQLGGFTRMDLPLMVGPSRKHFLGHIVGDANTELNEFATAAAVTAAILNGAHLIRVHDVKAMKAVVDVADEILRGAHVAEPVEAPTPKKSNFVSQEGGGYRAGMSARKAQPAAEAKSKALVPPIAKPVRKPVVEAEPVEVAEEIEERKPIAPAIFKSAHELDADDELEVDALDEPDELADEELDEDSDLDDLIIELDDDDDEDDDEEEDDEDDEDENEDEDDEEDDDASELDFSPDSIEQVAAKKAKAARSQPIARDPRVGRSAPAAGRATTGARDREGATRGSSRPVGRPTESRSERPAAGGYRKDDRADSRGPARTGRPAFGSKPLGSKPFGDKPASRFAGKTPFSSPSRGPRDASRGDDRREGDRPREFTDRGPSRGTGGFKPVRRPDDRPTAGSRPPREGARPGFEKRPFEKRTGPATRSAGPRDEGERPARFDSSEGEQGESRRPPTRFGGFRPPFGSKPSGSKPFGAKPFKKPYESKPFRKDGDRPTRDAGKPSFKSSDLLAGRPKREGFTDRPKPGGFGRGPSSDRAASDRPRDGKPPFKKPFGKPSFGKSDSGKPSFSKPGFKKPGGRPTSSGSAGRNASPSGRRPPSGPRRGK